MPYPRWRKYTIDEEFFATWSRELAWLVGYITADGNVNKALTAITIVSAEQKPLLLARTLAGSDAPLYLRPKERNIHKGAQDAYALKLSNRAVVEALVNIGVKPNKSKCGGVPRVPVEFRWHFLRGLIDGDGNIHIPRNKGGLRLTLVNHHDIIGHVAAQVQAEGIKCTVKQVVGADALCVYGQHADALLSRVYADSAGLRLERKFDTYTDWQQNHKPLGVCALCAVVEVSTRKNNRYCASCKRTRQRLMNRRSDHLRRNGVLLPWKELAHQDEQPLHLEQLDMCARIYGRRAASNRAKRALAAAETPE